MQEKNLRALAQISLGSTRLDTTRRVRRVELVEQHSSTRLTRRARLSRHDELDWLDTLVTLDAFVSTSWTRNLVCCVVCIKLYYVSYSLI